MKRSKLIIRFLEKHDAESVRKTLDDLYRDWREATSPPVKIEQYVRNHLNEICDFVSELDQYLWQGNFSDVGFYILTKSFFDKSSFNEREQFILEFLEDRKRNSLVKKKRIKTHRKAIEEFT